MAALARCSSLDVAVILVAVCIRFLPSVANAQGTQGAPLPAQPDPTLSRTAPTTPVTEVSSLRARIEQIEKSAAEARKSMNDDEANIEKDTLAIKEFGSHEDRYLALASLAVTCVSVILVGISLGIGYFTFTMSRKTEEVTLERSNAAILRLESSTNSKLHEFEIKFSAVLETANKAADSAKAHSEAAHQHLELGKKDAVAIANLRQITERDIAKIVENARTGLFERQFAGAANAISAADIDRNQDAADILSKFGGNTKFDKKFDLGLVEYSKGNYDAALNAFRTATENPPDDLSKAKVLYSIAATLARMETVAGSQEQALSVLNEVISLQDKLLVEPALTFILARAQLARADILRRRNDFAAAKAGYTWIIDRFADQTDDGMRAVMGMALVQRGIVFSASREYSRAIEDYDALLMRYSNSAEPELHRQVILAQYNKGRALLETKEWSLAASTFRDTVQLLEGATDRQSREIQEHARIGLANALDQLGEKSAN
jgi:tetratricopeptide (TPR) repeat protein